MTRSEGGIAAEVTTLPLVSVIVVNYNHAALLAQAVGSVMAQTYAEIECIVVDDASTDDSARVIAELQTRFARLKAILRPSNGGALPASLDGLASADGEFVHFLDADDLILPALIETHVATHLSLRAPVGFTCSDMIVSSKNAIVTACDMNIARYRDDPACRPAHQRTLPPFLASRFGNADRDMEILKVEPWHIDWPWSATSAIVYRRRALHLFADAVGTDTIRWTTDLFFCPGINAITGSAILDAPLAVYRLHGANEHALTTPLNHLIAFDKVRHMKKRAAVMDVLIAHLIAERRRFADQFWDGRMLLDVLHRLGRFHPDRPSRFEIVRRHGRVLAEVVGWKTVLRWVWRA